MKILRITLLTFAVLVIGGVFSSCSSERLKNHAMESAAHYWQDKAYPGKASDVQVIEATKNSDGLYQVKGIVDGETRIGVFNPETETFNEGYYSLAHEREKHIAELEQEAKYWKEKAEALDKENYKLKVKLGVGDDGAPAAAAPVQTSGSVSAVPNGK